MAFLDFLKASAFKAENEKLKSLIQEMGAGDILTLKNKLDELQSSVDAVVKQKQLIELELSSLERIIKEKKGEIIVLDDEILLESFALYKPKFKFTSSAEFKSALDICREKQKDLIKQGDAVRGNENWTVNNSKSEGKKMVNDMKKLLLRSFNNECDYCVDNVKFNNIEMNEKRIDKSYEALTKLGRMMDAQISAVYRGLKFNELHLAFEYQKKKEEEKEALKRAREELREQQKVEQEIRLAREKIAKEKKHYCQAIKELEFKLNEANDEIGKALIQNKLDETRLQLGELDKEEKVIDYREQNAKAGYVYIISNIGAFGENIFKIGMTRRLEPMDRVDELGDASVPFSFDVHALIFSDNAPILENKLHQHFYGGRLNKLNNRKEFFRADILEIEKVVRDNYDKVVDILKIAPAEQYRESLKIV